MSHCHTMMVMRVFSLLFSVDVYLHRHSAGHGPFLPQQGGPCPQRVARQVPEGEEKGGPGPVPGYEAVEGGQVDFLLVPHVLDGVAHSSLTQHCVLPGVDAVCPELSGVVNSAINQTSRLSAV